MEHQLVNVDAAQQARQLVVSSTAFDLVRAAAPDNEVRASLSQDVKAAIPVALRGIRQDLATGGPADHEAIVVSLGRQIGLLKAGLASEHKEDWIGLAFSELACWPPDMVLEALRDVRKRARFEGDVVPMVLEIVEPKVQRLQTELKHLERLEALTA